MVVDDKTTHGLYINVIYMQRITTYCVYMDMYYVLHPIYCIIQVHADYL